MKNNIAVIIALAIVMGLSSCKSKMSEKMKEEFNQVKTDWSIFTSDLTSYGDTLKRNKENITNDDRKILKKIGKSKDEKFATFKSNCVNNETTLNNLWKSFDDFQKSFADSTTAFNAWVGKVDTLKTSDKEVKMPIENYKTFLANSNTTLAQWRTDMSNAMDAAKKDIDDATKLVGADKPKAAKDGKSGTKKKKKK